MLTLNQDRLLSLAEAEEKLYIANTSPPQVTIPTTAPTLSLMSQKNHMPEVDQEELDAKKAAQVEHVAEISKNNQFSNVSWRFQVT